MKNYDLYLIVNKINEKRYIGITKVGFQKRFEKHLINAKRFYRQHQNMVLYLSVRKHDAKNFSVEFLQEGNDWEHLKKLEVVAIIKYNTFIDDGFGYNMTRGGSGANGYKWTQEQLDRRTERGLTKEHKANISKGHARYWQGRSHSIETIEKIKRKRATQSYSKETRDKMSRSRQNGKNPMAKSVLIGDLYFETVKEAAEYVGIHPDSLSRRITNSSNFLDHIWATTKRGD